MRPLIASAMLILSATTHAEPTYDVGVEDAHFMPYYRVDETGDYRGFACDLLDAFATQSRVRLVYRPLPADELLPALLAGSIDLKYPDSPVWSATDKTGHTLQYSQATVAYVDGVMVAPRRLGLDVEQLKRLAVVDGWTPRGYETQVDGGRSC